MGNCLCRYQINPIDEPEFVTVYDYESEYSYDHSIDHKYSPILPLSNDSSYSSAQLFHPI